MRFYINIIWWSAFFIAGASLVFLLFSLGHHDYFPLWANVVSTCTAVTAALVIAILQWAGTPIEEEEPTTKKGGRRRRAR